MRPTSRAISVCVTALTAMAILIPTQTATAATHATTPDTDTITSIPTGPPRLTLNLTDDQAIAAGLSLDESTTLTLPTGGHVLATPMLDPESTNRSSFHVRKRWWSIVVYFNKRETARIAAGFGVCATVVGKVPYIGYILTVYCGLLGAYAGYLMSVNRCLRATVIHGSVAPAWGSHRGRYCR